MRSLRGRKRLSHVTNENSACLEGRTAVFPDARLIWGQCPVYGGQWSYKDIVNQLKSLFCCAGIR